MRVKILLAVPDEASYGPCTVVLDSIRVGYPNAIVEVFLNPIAEVRPTMAGDIARRATQKDCQVSYLRDNTPHARWIFDRVIEHSADLGDQEPLIILDGDILFHSSCENWVFDNCFIAGYRIPAMGYFEFTQCPTLARLHTSHLWFTQPRTLIRGISKVFPAATMPRADLCPLDLFSPDVKFINGIPHFWDSCANLYQMFGGKAFGPEHLACYEHLFSASAFELKKSFAANPGAAEWLHTEGFKHPELLKGALWEATNRYYAERSCEKV
jgi:hypothetical protein